MEVKKKTCKTCGRELPLVEFNRNPTTKDGRMNNCRACANPITKEREKQKREERKQWSPI